MYQRYLHIVFLIGCLFSWTSDLSAQNLKYNAGEFTKGNDLAVVNGDTLYGEIFEESYVKHLAQTGANDTPQERESHLQHLIETMLLAQEAKHERLDQSDEHQRFMDLKMNRALVDLYLKEMVHDTVRSVTDEEVEQAFLRTNINLFVRQLYFTNRDEAESYKHRLEKGENFVDLANELYNTKTYSDKAGYIGEVKYFDLDDAVAETIYNIEVGEVSPIIMADNGYYIMRIENVKRNPLLTETQLNQKKKKVRFLAQSRRHRLSANSFIRSEMSKLDVTPEVDQIRQLHRILSTLVASKEEKEMSMPVRVIGHSDIQTIQESFSEETTLARYRTGNGEVREFKAEDFFRWLPSIGAQQVVSQTIPAVGRAIFYEEFSNRAKEMNLQKSSMYQFNKSYVQRFHLAGLMKQQLDAQPVEEMDEQFVEQVQERYQQRVVTYHGGSYQKKVFSTAEEAENFIAEVSDSEMNINLPTHTADSLSEIPGIGPHLKNLSLNQWYVVGTADGNFVATKILKRDSGEKEDSISDEEIRSALKEKYNYMMKVKELRQQADISINRGHITEMMEYYSP